MVVPGMVHVAKSRIPNYKRMGYTNGTPDLMIYKNPPHPNYSGLWLEMKRVGTGVVSEVQVEVLHWAREAGMATAVAWGAEQAKGYVRDYMSNRPVTPDLPQLPSSVCSGAESSDGGSITEAHNHVYEARTDFVDFFDGAGGSGSTGEDDSGRGPDEQ